MSRPVFYHSGGDLMYAPPGAAPYRMERLMAIGILEVFAEEWIALLNHGLHSDAVKVRQSAEELHRALDAQGKWKAAAWA